LNTFSIERLRVGACIDPGVRMRTRCGSGDAEPVQVQRPLGTGRFHEFEVFDSSRGRQTIPITLTVHPRGGGETHDPN